MLFLNHFENLALNKNISISTQEINDKEKERLQILEEQEEIESKITEETEAQLESIERANKAKKLGLEILKLVGKELGKFKMEAVEEKAKYVRQKTYITMEKGEYHITCAGMTDAMKETTIKTYKNHVFDIFAKGFEIGGKLIPKHVKGGIVLYETTFKIRS